MLRDMLRTTALVGALVGLLGCGNGVGNDGVIVGGSCLVSGECNVDSRCLTGARFPNGYCAKSCDGPDDCPDGSACVDAPDFGAMCLLTCTAASDCRSDDGYECAELPAHGAGGTSMVCALP